MAKFASSSTAAASLRPWPSPRPPESFLARLPPPNEPHRDVFVEWTKYATNACAAHFMHPPHFLFIQPARGYIIEKHAMPSGHTSGMHVQFLFIPIARVMYRPECEHNNTRCTNTRRQLEYVWLGHIHTHSLARTRSCGKHERAQLPPVNKKKKLGTDVGAGRRRRVHEWPHRFGVQFLMPRSW